MGIKIPVAIDAEFDSLFSGVKQFKRKVQRELQKPGLKGGSSPGLMDSIFFPKGGNVDQIMRKDMGKSMKTMFRTVRQSIKTQTPTLRRWMKPMNKAFDFAGKGTKAMGGGLNKVFKGIKASARVASAEMKGLGRLINDNTKSLQRMAKFTGGIAGRGAKMAGRGMMRGGRMIGRGARAVGRGAAFAGMMGARGLAGIVTGAFSEGVGAYEGRSNARLEASKYLIGDKGQRPQWASGVGMGYNASQAAGIQGSAARMGMGSGKHAGQFAMEMQRGFGSEGMDFAAGITRRRGKEISSAGGLKKMRTEISQIFGAAVHTGLKSARLPEFMQAANSFAEKQLSITPDKDSLKSYVGQLAFVQERGGAGMKGKYGAAALGQIDSAVKGAGGPQQAFLMRAFGFGKGSSFLDVTRRQEAGIGNKENLPAIMKQLQSEYGAGKHGGLSAQGLLAFKGMGFGSTTMGEKFGKMFLQGGDKGLTKEQTQKKIDQLMNAEKDKRLAPIQKRAYIAMGNFGGVAKNLAKRFDEFAALGKKFYGIKKSITDASIAAAKGIAPILKDAVIPIAKGVKDFLQNWGPTFSKWLTRIMKSIERLAAGIGGFFRGMAKSPSGGWTDPFKSLRAGAKGGAAAMTAIDEKRGGQAFASKASGMMKKLNRSKMGSTYQGQYDDIANTIKDIKAGNFSSKENMADLMQNLNILMQKYGPKPKAHTTKPGREKRVGARVKPSAAK